MNRFLNFLGLTRKSGNLTAGGNLTEAAVKHGRVRLVILALDASDGTRKKLQDMTAHFGVELIEASTMDELGSAIGKGEISVIGVTDLKMSEKLKELWIAM
ncbi:MAG: ribosomal L7Ae/L30e/S12e/Gadd45 family protein [Clostridiaceae bacterium]